MNKRDREQLRASIAKDLVQGQGEHSPTKELLKQYAPLEGIITTPAPDISRRPGSAPPVENSLAPHATVAPPATVERLATVKGELRVLWKRFHNTRYPRFGIMEGCSGEWRQKAVFPYLSSLTRYQLDSHNSLVFPRGVLSTP